MGLAVCGLKLLLPESFLSTVLMILTGVSVYVLIACLDHALEKSDLQGILRPGRRHRR